MKSKKYFLNPPQPKVVAGVDEILDSPSGAWRGESITAMWRDKILGPDSYIRGILQKLPGEGRTTHFKHVYSIRNSS